MIADYLKDLILDKIFKPYANNVENFIHYSNKSEHIVDSRMLPAEKSISGFVTDTFGRDEDNEDKYFAVNNPECSNFALLQIDNGMIKSSKTKKCDCIIVNGQIFCLIEFKTNVTTNSVQTLQTHYDNAIVQLSRTKDIINEGLLSEGKKIQDLRDAEAYICFKHGHPTFTSSQVNVRTRFAEANEGMPLYFSQEKTI